MKRFYCTECKRVKRVRNLPTNVKYIESYNAQDRIGTCDWHVTGRISPVRVSYKKVKTVVVTKQKKAS